MFLSKQLSEKIREGIEDLLLAEGFEIYEMQGIVENGQKVFRLFVDHPEGITPDGCEQVSRIVSRVFDVEDYFPFPYTLEVSSPGIFRELRTDSDFARFLNHRVKVVYFVDEIHKNSLHGVLKNRDSESLYLEQDGTLTPIALENIIRTELAPIL